MLWYDLNTDIFSVPAPACNRSVNVAACPYLCHIKVSNKGRNFTVAMPHCGDTVNEQIRYNVSVVGPPCSGPTVLTSPGQNITFLAGKCNFTLPAPQCNGSISLPVCKEPRAKLYLVGRNTYSLVGDRIRYVWVCPLIHARANVHTLTYARMHTRFRCRGGRICSNNSNIFYFILRNI